MHLTHESEYALRGLAFPASQNSHDVASLGEIAAAQGFAHTPFAKLFQKMMVPQLEWILDQITLADHVAEVDQAALARTGAGSPHSPRFRRTT